MKDRILKIINKEQLTASRFADIVGVQRSSVSHILSGRNKPSLDFVQRILTEFKSINPEWLLFGNGDIYKKESMPSLFDNSNRNITEVNKPSNVDNPENTSKQDGILNSSQHQVLKETSASNRETVKKGNLLTENSQNNVEPAISKIFSKSSDKVIVFFSDNTFKEYSPAD